MLRIAVMSVALLALAGAAAQGQTQTQAQAQAQAPVQAPGAAPDSENGRYTFRPIGEELLRLDGRTGQVSVCAKRPAGWSCLLAPDERTALESEIVRLQGDNATLKRELITRGITLPGGMQAPKQGEGRTDEIVIKLPSETDVERLRAMLEKAWERLRNMTQELFGQDPAPQPGEPKR